MNAIEQIQQIAQQVEDGEVNALEKWIELKRIEKALKSAMDSIKLDAHDEALKDGRKIFDFKGVQIELKSGGGRWDYKHLPWWDEFTKKQKDAQAANKSDHQIVTDDGEVIQPAIYKANAQTFSVSKL